jgi:hypothetical protein
VTWVGGKACLARRLIGLASRETALMTIGTGPDTWPSARLVVFYIALLSGLHIIFTAAMSPCWPFPWRKGIVNSSWTPDDVIVLSS